MATSMKNNTKNNIYNFQFYKNKQQKYDEKSLLPSSATEQKLQQASSLFWRIIKSVFLFIGLVGNGICLRIFGTGAIVTLISTMLFQVSSKFEHAMNMSLFLLVMFSILSTICLWVQAKYSSTAD